MSAGAGALGVDAPAKVNLVLRVLGGRSDGYHDIETLFQAIALSDRVVVTRRPDGVTLDVRGAELGPTEENLAYRAARALLEATGATVGLHVGLEKRIPAGAGLGGGSSDAAAVLRLGNRLLGAPLDDTRRDGAPLGGGLLDPVALAEVGASLGSDVPFFLGDAGLSWGRGRGERLEPLAPLPDASVVVVMPPVHVATGSAYAALARGRVVGGHPPCSGTFPDAPASWAEVAAAACNAFEAVIPATHPPVERALAALRAAGAAPGLLAGSGGACFGIFAERAAAEAAAAALRRSLGWPVEVTRTLSALPDGLALPAG